jgi:hypothetical protein
MRPGTQLVERERWEGFDDRLHECFASRSVLRGGTVDTVQQFGGSDHRDAHVLSGAEDVLEPATHRAQCGAHGKPAQCPFDPDEDGGV